jgi:hypothetical protein
MKTKEKQEVAVIDFTKFSIQQLPELQGKKEEIKSIVKANPIVEVTDNASYELAKKSRTAVKTLRTGLEKEQKEVNSRIKKNVLEIIADAYSSLIEELKIDEYARQEPITIWETKKEEERLEKIRLEEERVSGIKNRISQFTRRWEDIISVMTFHEIELVRKDFEKETAEYDAKSLEEFEILYFDELSSLGTFFSQKSAVLVAEETNRLEQVRLAKERAENEREIKIRNQIQSWYNNWSATIDALSFFNHSGYFDDFKNEKTLDCQEFQSDYAEKRTLLIQKFESKIALLQQIEDNRIASEKLAKEKADFEIKRLDIRFNLVRKKELAEIGLLEEGTDFKHHSLGKLTSFEYIRNCTEEDFDKFLANTKYAILKEEKANEPVVEEKDFDFDKSFEEAIVKLPIGELETMEVDFEETWDSIFEDYEQSNRIYSLPEFLEYLKENYEVPLKK